MNIFDTLENPLNGSSRISFWCINPVTCNPLNNRIMPSLPARDRKISIMQNGLKLDQFYWESSPPWSSIKMELLYDKLNRISSYAFKLEDGLA